MEKLEFSQDQTAAIEAFQSFVKDSAPGVFVLAGPAGTGKTTLTRVLGDILREHKYETAYTALTGRAASIARERSRLPFTTLHAYLYQFDDLASTDTETGPKFAFKLRSTQLPGRSAVLVDESSMLGDTDQTSAMLQFGSGNPLRDLLRRLFSPGMHIGKLILIGDQYQLPPVGTEQSTVFMPDQFAALCQKVLGGPLPIIRAHLTTVFRQKSGGQLLELATQYRTRLEQKRYDRWIPALSAGEITVFESSDLDARRKLAAEVAESNSTKIVIAHTNESVAEWNELIRLQRWGSATCPPRTSDRIMVVRKVPSMRLLNGEFCEIISMEDEWVDLKKQIQTSKSRGGGYSQRIEHRVRLQKGYIRTMAPPGTATSSSEAPEASENALTVWLIVDNLLLGKRDSSPEDVQVLWADFRARNSKLKANSKEYWEAARNDPFLNAVDARYGYAVTCHKAQGGQWPGATIDFTSYAMPEQSEDGHRWAYTAITRASSQANLLMSPEQPVSALLESLGL